jgi:hypothetical protein
VNERTLRSSSRQSKMVAAAPDYFLGLRSPGVRYEAPYSDNRLLIVADANIR